VRLVFVCLLLVACAPSAVTATPSPTATATATAEPSSAPTETPRDIRLTAAGEFRGQHALVQQWTYEQAGIGEMIRIWDAPLDGSIPRELVAYHRGPQIVTQWDNSDIARQLSPDGRKLIVADALDVAGTGLFVIDLVSGSAAAIVTNGGADQLAWSPDGRHIAFRGFTVSPLLSHETGIWVVDAAGGAPTLVWRSDQTPGASVTMMRGWTGDGAGIAISRDTSSVSVIDVSTRTIAQIATGYIHDIAFRAKRPAVAIATSDPPPRSSAQGAPGNIGATGRLEVRDGPSGASRTAFSHPNVGTLLWGPRWSPTTDEVLLHWVCGAGAAQRDELVAVDVVKSSSRTMPVSGCVRSLSWSADGAKILYSLFDSVRVRNADGTNDKELMRAALPQGATQSYIGGVTGFAGR
jgi:hypothetical protein